MNKIPKCAKKIIPNIKANKKEKKEFNFKKIKILTNKHIARSFCNDIINITKRKEVKVAKKSSSCSGKVSIIYNNIIIII